MRLLISALAAAALLAPTAAEAKGGQTVTLATRDSLIHGVAGDADSVFVSEPGIGVAKHGPRVVVLDRDHGRQKAVLPAPAAGFKMPFTLRVPKPGRLVVLDSGGFPPQGPPVVYEYRYRTEGAFKATLTRAIDFAGKPMGFAEDVETLPDGALVVSESVYGGLWLITRDGAVVPAMVPDGTPLPKLGPCTFKRPDNTVGGLPLRGAGDFAPGAGSLAVRGGWLYFSSTCEGGVQRIAISTLEDTSRPAAERAAEIKTVTPRKYDLESLKGITFNPYDKRDPWIYSGDPFRRQLIRINSLTGKREVLSSDHRRLDFTTATTFLPPEHKGEPAPLVTVSDQEYRWATLNTALSHDMFRPPWTVAEYTPR